MANVCLLVFFSTFEVMAMVDLRVVMMVVMDVALQEIFSDVYFFERQMFQIFTKKTVEYEQQWGFGMSEIQRKILNVQGLNLQTSELILDCKKNSWKKKKI